MFYLGIGRMRFIIYLPMFLLLTTRPLLTASAGDGGSVDPQVISLGSWGGAILEWVLVIISPTIATLVSWLIYKALSWIGVQIDAARREKLQDIIINGVNLAARGIHTQLQSFAVIPVKNQVTLDVIQYVKDNAKETLRALNIDPNDPNLAQIIAARVERALNDPLAPTPPVITPPEVLSMGRTRQSPSLGTDGVEQRAPDDSVSHVVYGHSNVGPPAGTSGST